MPSKEPRSDVGNFRQRSILLCAAAYSITPKLVGFAIVNGSDLSPEVSLSNLYS